jgi:hypothetical protein
VRRDVKETADLADFVLWPREDFVGMGHETGAAGDARNGDHAGSPFGMLERG